MAIADSTWSMMMLLQRFDGVHCGKKALQKKKHCRKKGRRDNNSTMTYYKYLLFYIMNFTVKVILETL